MILSNTLYQTRIFRMPAGVMLLLLPFVASCSRTEIVQKLNFVAGQYTPSKNCGSCHRDIYAGWASSMHANAGLEAVFHQVFEQVAAVDRGRAEAVCYPCHSPARVYGAAGISKEISLKEGIGCDFCHSIVTSDLKGKDRPYTLDFGPVKRGPIKDAVSMVHEVEYSDMHVRSVMCAGCHEYRKDGIPLFTTYSEWVASSYSEEGVNCQRCHMPYVLADVVEPRVKRVGNVAVNLHQMPGGHSRQMMHKALRAAINSVSREDGQIVVSVGVANTGAGHSVPTGTPTRRVVLTVQLTTETGQQQLQQMIYQKKVVDQAGESIQRDFDLFMNASAIESDNRIRAKESRTETFQFKDYPGENLTIQARLTYLYTPHGKKESEVRFDFYSEERHLVSRFTRDPG